MNDCFTVHLHPLPDGRVEAYLTSLDGQHTVFRGANRVTGCNRQEALERLFDAMWAMMELTADQTALPAVPVNQRGCPEAPR
jgi:hypothetical protein